MPAVALVDPLDHLLAPVGVEVDVDVGLLVAVLGDEPLERQPVEDRVDRGDAERVADRRAGRRSPALAEDPLRPRELARCRGRSRSSRRSPSRSITRSSCSTSLAGLLLEPGRRRSRCGEARARSARAASWSAVCPSGMPRLGSRGVAFCRSKAHLVGELDAARHRARVAREPARHLRTRPQAGHRPDAGSQPSISARLRRARTAAIAPATRCSLGSGVVDVVGGHHRQPVLARRCRRAGRCRAVGRVPVVGQLDHDVARGRTARSAGPAPAAAAIGPVPASAWRTAPLRQPVSTSQCRRGPVGELAQVVGRPALLVAAQLGVGDRAGQPVVALDARGRAPAGGCPRGRRRRSAAWSGRGTARRRRSSAAVPSPCSSARSRRRAARRRTRRGR